MMQWMSDFGKLKDHGTVEQQIGFLDKMEGKASNMQSQFDDAIRNAENYVNNHKH